MFLLQRIDCVFCGWTLSSLYSAEILFEFCSLCVSVFCTLYSSLTLKESSFEERVFKDGWKLALGDAVTSFENLFASWLLWFTVS